MLIFKTKSKIHTVELINECGTKAREDLGPFSRGSADFWRGGEKFFLPTFCYAFKRYKL